MLNKIRDHPMHTVLAIGIVAIGLFLIINDHYFIWPPHYTEWLNDDIVGFLFVIDGLGIGGWMLWETQLAAINRLLLTATSFLMSFLTILQLLTSISTGIYTSWISNAIITAFVLILARRSDSRDSSDNQSNC
ncbi:hypothetical protein FEZ34_14615 [Lacticaseibacillus casei]|uniref:hypothetical protein n=1 Tax=Lacticaseibacillus casei TaxID=1582 RepID=UPI001109D21E|nr:hypothetical protein [Lacticaseibacillus casei]TLQ49605.1 hypothetical protein FEZ34_14615 [Lacticaseibacillus casei]